MRKKFLTLFLVAVATASAIIVANQPDLPREYVAPEPYESETGDAVDILDTITNGKTQFQIMVFEGDTMLVDVNDGQVVEIKKYQP